MQLKLPGLGLKGFLFAALVAGVVTLLAPALGRPPLGVLRLLSLFIIGVGLTAYYFSWIPALALYAASIAITNSIFAPDFLLLRFRNIHDVMRLVIYSAINLGIVAGARRLYETRRSLSRSEEKYRLLVEHASDGILITDRNNAVEANSKAHEMLGYSPGELLRRKIRDLIPPEDLTAWWGRFSELLDGRTILYECRLLRKDGASLAVEASGKMLQDGRILLIIRDISERQRREEQLRQTQRLEAVARLAVGVAREFNNLLTVITGYTDLVLESLGLHTPVRADLEEIRRAAQRAGALTRQLVVLDLKMPAEPELVDLNTLVAEMEGSLRDLAGEKIRIVTSLDPGIGQVKSEPAQLQQAIRNLVLQARHAMPGGGVVTITTTSAVIDREYAGSHQTLDPGHYVLLAVSDTGAGLDPETQSHIFEPFFVSKKLAEGSGLGLCAAYGTVRRSGGHIRVHSELGRGSTFKIHLPRV